MVPVSLDLTRGDNVLEIRWPDGSTSRLSGLTLRWACPCAECHGEAGLPGRLDSIDRLSDDELQLQDAALVGRYGLQISFKSGHGTGIYTFELLRELGSSVSA